MSPQPRVALPPYTHTRPPGAYTPGFFVTELGKIERAIPVPSIRTVRASLTAQTNDQTVLVDASGGAVTVTLPLVSNCVGLTLTVKKVDASANAVTIGATVDGVATPALTSQYQAMTMQSDGVSWHLIASV